MTLTSKQFARWGGGALLLAVVTGGSGYWLGLRSGSSVPHAATEGRTPLYYFDPMFPNQKFDKPGKSPFMDMELVPKYAGEGDAPGAPPEVTIDPAQIQSLGIRLATVTRGTLADKLDVAGTIDFNQRNVAIVQARSGGFVQRSYNRAPGDIVPAGAPIADLLVPEWGGAQQEFLAVRRLGDPKLTAASKQRMRLLGMPDGVIAHVERTGRASGVVTITTPVGGAIQQLDAQVILEALHELGDRRLRNAQRVGGPGESAGFHHANEHSHRLHLVERWEGRHGADYSRLETMLSFGRDLSSPRTAIPWASRE